eukprot:g5014.t1
MRRKAYNSVPSLGVYEVLSELFELQFVGTQQSQRGITIPPALENSRMLTSPPVLVGFSRGALAVLEMYKHFSLEVNLSTAVVDGRKKLFSNQHKRRLWRKAVAMSPYALTVEVDAKVLAEIISTSDHHDLTLVMPENEEWGVDVAALFNGLRANLRKLSQESQVRPQSQLPAVADFKQEWQQAGRPSMKGTDGKLATDKKHRLYHGDRDLANGRLRLLLQLDKAHDPGFEAFKESRAVATYLLNLEGGGKLRERDSAG